MPLLTVLADFRHERDFVGGLGVRLELQDAQGALQEAYVVNLEVIGGGMADE